MAMMVRLPPYVKAAFLIPLLGVLGFLEWGGKFACSAFSVNFNKEVKR
jgi:hypothetical protein